MESSDSSELSMINKLIFLLRIIPSGTVLSSNCFPVKSPDMRHILPAVIWFVTYIRFFQQKDLIRNSDRSGGMSMPDKGDFS